jgi:hypothetical protein
MRYKISSWLQTSQKISMYNFLLYTAAALMAFYSSIEKHSGYRNESEPVQ